MREIARSWPSVVRHGGLDRAALAEIVFHDPGARERLNAIVHPHVRRLAAANEAYAKPGQIIVQVVPLLFETNYDEVTEKSILVIAPAAQRIARIRQRDGLSEEQIRARMQAQIDPEEAKRRADYVIENDGDFPSLKERTRTVYESLAAVS